MADSTQPAAMPASNKSSTANLLTTAVRSDDDDQEASEGASSGLSGSHEDILGVDEHDPALKAKMHLVNDAIDQIGWTNYHWKLFVLNGFGYAVDSMLTLLQSIVATSAFREFGQVGYSAGLNVASYTGLLLGAIFWGFGADIIGRKWAFNISLFICSIATIISGAMPSWPSLGLLVAVVGFGGGGNLILDTAVFLEFLPSSKQWALTALACWWGFGQAIAGFIAWGFMSDPRFNCTEVGCPRESNMGWRYVYFTGGALVLVASVLRVTIIRLRETPKYLLCVGRDAEVVETLHFIATKYDRPCSLTFEQLDACGVIRSAHSSKSRFSVGEFTVHLRGLFSSKQLALSTSLIWLSWTLIGLAYPLFYVFLNTYLANRVTDELSTFDRWRNYTLGNISGIPGPMVAGLMCNTDLLGRKYTMVIGALLTMVFFFSYTTVTSATQNVVFSCVIAFSINIYYATLYAYTPEVLPSAHRGTGNGISVAFNRIMGIVSSVVATTTDTSTPVPLYICAALFVAMAIVAAAFPFEPHGRRSS